MNKLIATNPHNYLALVARLALGVVVFAHGAQKLFGWFGGPGFSGSMGFLTGKAHLPYIIALLVIIIECIGALALIFGFLTRLAALAVIIDFVGIVIFSQAYNSFFMNWYRQPNVGEGLEYFILLFGLAIVCLIAGGGKASVDSALQKSYTSNHTNIHDSNENAVRIT